MAATNPLTSAEQARIRELNAQGVSRNAIARELGRGYGTINKWCYRNGIHFDGTIPAAMAEAAAINVKERQVRARERKLLIDELMDAKVIAVLTGKGQWTTRLKTQGGGERFETVDFLPADDARNATSSAASLASAFKSYAPLETEAATEKARSVLDQLIESQGVPDE